MTSTAAKSEAPHLPPLFQDIGAEALALRQRIDALNADYAHCLDTDRLEDWPAFFTEDGVYRVVTRENRERGLPVALIYARGRGMLADRITALRTANIFEPHVYCHQTSGVKVIGPAAEGGWHAESNFVIVRTMASGAMTVFACGRYVDRLVDVGGGLRLAERNAVLDSKRVDTLMVIPV
jgi:anthranilate 1,2-dioxygenase small subunit